MPRKKQSNNGAEPTQEGTSIIKAEAEDNKKEASPKVSFRPDHSASFPTFYSNYAGISHSPHDLCIDFCINAPMHKVEVHNDSPVVFFPVVARVIITPDMVDGLVKALKDQQEKYTTDKAEGRIALTV